ncbi:ankyrin repeat-containing protein [Heterostelium album PN500]|uniref:Ankyrin repeat-containing protein n=1 Tax=Heterostelium pallidum (strain ATCC 26659 / Pp 5 / PN500) TaxID=670386 RepID=D3BSU1_HETP5|nr:ankyrin repeat-containing protein [Heterostelium album PN500]EFA75556.1 ankyrin repeat-containing protein [Heterostelium album PN500]|eukprot:XP_020427690.1 ankyrin repeat-containing protein [Heterostelium album PN500]
MMMDKNSNSEFEKNSTTTLPQQQQPPGLPLSPCLATMTTKTTTTTTTTTITEHNFLVPELLVISPRLETPLNTTTTMSSSFTQPIILVPEQDSNSNNNTSSSPPNNNTIDQISNNICSTNNTSSSDYIMDDLNKSQPQQVQQPSNSTPTPQPQQSQTQPQQSSSAAMDSPVIFKTTSSTSTTTTSHTVTTPALENRAVSTSPPSTPMLDDCQIELGARNNTGLSKSPPLQSSSNSTNMENDKLSPEFINAASISKQDQTLLNNINNNNNNNNGNNVGNSTVPNSPTTPQIQIQLAPSSPLSTSSSSNSNGNGSGSGRKSHRSTSVPLIRNRIQRPIRQKSPSSMGERPLLHAVLVQEEIKTLINQEDINMRDSNGNSILHRVSIIGSMLAIRHMVLRGARVNSTNNSGMTPLHYAACANPQSVEVLLYYGSLPNSKDNNRETPLFYAVDRGQFSIVSLLLSRGAKVTTVNKAMSRNSIHVAALKGYSNILRLLLDYKSNINAPDVNGSTPFHLCVYHSPPAQNLMNPINYQSVNNIDAYMSCCELLLQRGATLTLQDTQGYTPIHIASRQGKKNIIDVILFYCKQQKNKLPQSILSSIPNASKFKKELKSEIVLYIDDMGMTPLCLASMFGHFDCVEYLYNLDPKLNQQCRFYTSSSIDCSKTPIDPLGNDFRFALDGDYCDLVFIIDGRDIFAHSIMLRQYKFFRDMISSCKSLASLHPHSLNNATGHGSHQQLHSHQYGGIYGSQYSYNNSYISRSHDDSSIHYHSSSIMDGGYYDVGDDSNYYNHSSSNSMDYISANISVGNGVATSRARTRSRMNSVVNPGTLTRIPVEKGISYEIFRAILQFAYTSEIPREIINTTGKLSELLDFANQFDIESLSNLCVDTLSQHSTGRMGTLEMSKYLLKQINSKHSADVTIIYDGGQVVLAHSVILANRSTFFKLHFESYPVLSRSAIQLFPNNVNNISSSMSSSYGNSSLSNIAGTSTPHRKLSCPSSPALSDIPTMGWVIDIGEASQKAVFVMLEYLYAGCIPSGNSLMQPSLYPLLNQKLPSTASEMDVIDMLLLSKLAYALNLPVLQQYSTVLLYSALDPLKLVTIIKTIFSFDGNVGWGRTSSLELMWGVCLEWLTKKCNWEEVNRCEAFISLGLKFIKDVKKERKDKKRKQKMNERQTSKSSQHNNHTSNNNSNKQSLSSSTTTTTTNNNNNNGQDGNNNTKKEEKFSTWSKMHPKEILRSVSSGFLINSNNNNNSNNNQSSFSVQTPNSPPTNQQQETPAYTSKNNNLNNGADGQQQNKTDSPKLTKQNSISNFLSKKKVFSTFARKPMSNRSKSFVI